MKTLNTPRALAWLLAPAALLSLSACVIAPVAPYHARVHVNAVATAPAPVVVRPPVVVVRPSHPHPHPHPHPHRHPHYYR